MGRCPPHAAPADSCGLLAGAAHQGPAAGRRAVANRRGHPMIDSHFHIWQLQRGDYGWLTPQCGRIYRDVSVADWQAQAQVNTPGQGVSHGILVQAAPSVAENELLLQQAALHPQQLLGVVGWVDLAADDAPARIAELARNPLLLGVRPMLQDIADPHWIVQPKVLAALATLPQHDLSFDALVKPVHLPHIGRLAKLLPALRIVIDHGAKPDIGGGDFAEWAQAMAWLSEYPNVWCKLSGLLNESGTPSSPAACTAYMTHILTCFSGRTLWGSDWPVLELAGNYGDWLTQCRRLADALRADPEEVFTRAAQA